MLKMLFRPVAVALLLAAPLLASAQQLRAHLLLTGRLSGDQETPAVTTNAQGVAGFMLNETRDTLFVQAAFSGLSGPITGAHVHEGAVGVAGPIITSLVPMVRGNRISGFLTGADIAQPKLSKYLKGQYYINVHTAANPNGEIRSQIRLESETALIASMTGAQETPAVTTSATGLGIFTLSQNLEKLKFRVAFAGLSSAITGAHFHTGAFGVAGPVVVSLLTYLSGNVIEGEIAPTIPFLTALSLGQVYINVHTTNNPNGEIRGQLFGEGRFVAHDARLDGNQMVPLNASTGKGLGIGRLTATLDTMFLYVAHAGLSGPPTSVAVYAALPGQANTVANLLGTLPVPATNTTNIIGLQISGPGLTPALINAFLRGEINVVLNTAANPNGEIRGQIRSLARDGYTIALNGAQERPTPTTSAGYGMGIVSIDRDQTNAHFMSVWGGLSGPATAGHFHTGLSTQAGPVIFNLVPYFDNTTTPAAAYGYWKDDNTAVPFTLRRSLQFRRDSMYMNLHTAAFPGGEIRGQVYRGARNLQRVLATQPAAVVAETFGTAPNPFSSALTLSFVARATGVGQVRVTDLLGRTVAAQPVAVRLGANTLPLLLPGAAPGLYLLTLEVGDTRLVTRIAKE
ncbi:CHRD domain-containing protein [Hymenobacter terricola]|uniref:CHRD domain-containing protein n=1 Tax=Hymenobacter terricola TaxID=2819236 RepID=UPI001B313D96|nr:CHRD domain-containing protein [Hymenobacter terricola]